MTRRNNKRMTKQEINDEFEGGNARSRRRARRHAERVGAAHNGRDAELDNLKKIHPITQSQSQAFSLWGDFDHLVLNGSAGTGKTYLAMYFALAALKEYEANNIIVIRSTVASREQGFLPGTIEEKQAPFEAPYKDIAADLLHRGDGYEVLKKAGKLKFMSSSYLRGLTFDNSIIIVDEFQNMTIEEINTIMTRVGDNTRIIICGDTRQDDLHFKRNDTSGFAIAMRVFEKMEKIGVVTFNHADIVRSQFVKSWIVNYEKEVA